MKVCSTGIWKARAKLLTTSEAFLRITPFPARMTGRFAPEMASPARGTWEGDGFRQFQMRRPRLFRLGDLKGLAYGFRNDIGSRDRGIPFGDRLEHRDRV